MRYRGYTIEQRNGAWLVYKGTEILKTGKLASNKEAREYVDKLIGTPPKAF